MIITLLIALVIFDNSASSSSTSNDDLCTSTDCIALSQEILSYIDPSIDPCEDFFSFQYEYEIAKPGQHQFFPEMIMERDQHNAFLSYLYDADDVIIEPSISKLKIFYDSCYSSDLEMENIESEQLLKPYLSLVSFTHQSLSPLSSQFLANWTANNKESFQKKQIIVHFRSVFCPLVATFKKTAIEPYFTANPLFILTSKIISI